MRLKRLSVVVMLALGTLVGVGTPAQAIVGGHDATERYPGLVSIQALRSDGTWGHTCGGTLRNGGWVRTNAHCVTNGDLSVRIVRVSVGSDDRTAGTIVDVSTVLVHASWSWGTQPGPVADIAMVKLARPVLVPPLRNAASGGEGTYTRIAGWGVTHATDTTLPTMLQEGDARQLSDEACAPAGISEGELCIGGGGGVGSCFGDSGGPALQRSRLGWVAVGSVSRGANDTGPDACTGPTVYTDLAYYEGWMRTVMATGAVPPANPAPRTARAGQPLQWLAGGLQRPPGGCTHPAPCFPPPQD
jgi:secreted trypsin-like serine protease